MAWVKLDDAMPHHPKVMAAGAQAFALDVAGIAYSNRFGTDGFIGADQLPAVLPCLSSPRKWVCKLVQVGRWHEVEGGWKIHDVDDYQPSAADQEAEREKARERMRKVRDRKRSSGEQKPNDQGSVRANSGRSSDTPSRPVPSDKSEPDGSDDDGRRKDLLFEAVIEACGLEMRELTKSARGAANKATKELRDIGASPEGVRARADVHRRKWPAMSVTPTSLAKNYALLGAQSNGSNDPTTQEFFAGVRNG